MATGYQDIEKQLIQRIEQGKLKPGDRVGPIRKLAEDFEASLVTADRALRELTRKGILNHVARQGFFVAEATQRLKGKIHVVMVSLDGKSPFCDLLDGIVGEAWPRGYQISVSCTQGKVEMCIEAVQRAMLEQVDGVIYMPGGQTKDFEKNRGPLKMMTDLPLPVVTVGRCRLPGLNPIAAVSSAHDQAGYTMAQHLLSRKLDQIAIVGVQPNQDEQAIIDGCQRAFREAKISIRPNWIRFHSRSESVAQDIQYLLHGRKRPTAIFALSDRVAAEAMSEIAQASLSIPEDIQVVGFGGYAIGELIRPTLTTMRINLHAVGGIAADLLIRQIEGHTVEAKHTPVPCQLLVRESCP